jgi:uncharacterized protein (TIGR03382 family)
MRAVHRLLWAVSTPALWAGGWLVSSQVIVDAHRQHAIFGGPAAITVGALSGLAQVRRRRPQRALSALSTPVAVPTSAVVA